MAAARTVVAAAVRELALARLALAFLVRRALQRGGTSPCALTAGGTAGEARWHKARTSRGSRMPFASGARCGI
jgi:hypothetical protein